MSRRTVGSARSKGKVCARRGHTRLAKQLLASGSRRNHGESTSLIAVGAWLASRGVDRVRTMEVRSLEDGRTSERCGLYESERQGRPDQPAELLDAFHACVPHGMAGILSLLLCLV